MVVETKYSIGDWVYYMECNSVARKAIKDIEISVQENLSKPWVRYRLKGPSGLFEEKLLYPSKEELLGSL